MSKLLQCADHFIHEYDWLEEHGFTRSEYIKRYGTAESPIGGGNGGEAIWEADIQHFERVRQNFLQLAKAESSIILLTNRVHAARRLAQEIKVDLWNI